MALLPIRAGKPGARSLVLMCLVVATALAWWYLADMARGMSHHGTLSGLGPGMAWLDAMLAAGGAMNAAHGAHQGIVLIAAMWVAMVLAMMLPVAAPMIATHADIAGNGRAKGAPPSPPLAFVGGYLLVWAALCAVAAPLQWWMQHNAWLNSQMAGASDAFAGSVLVLAGLYQFAPLKHACLHRCRTPLQFFLTRWRPGWRGALRMGAEHGAFCVGCCWALMALMFVVGVMNLVWIGLLAALMAAERVAPRGATIARVAGVGFVVWGTVLLVGTVNG